MKALRLYDIGDLRYEEVPLPEPEEDEVLLKVLASGICGSDIPRVFTKGTYHFPTIPGHEFMGEIVRAGSGAHANLVGKRAAVFPLLPCFACEACAEENYASCDAYDYYGSRRDGAFAEYIAVKIWNLVYVPDSVPDTWAAMTEPCAVGIHALAKVEVKNGDNVIIFGAGAIGLIIAQLARAQGAGSVMLLDVEEGKLSFAREQGFLAADSRAGSYLDEIMKLTGGRGAEVCIDAAGAGSSVSGCLKAAGAFGRVALMGNPAGDILLKQDDYWEIQRRQLTLKGSWNSDYGSRKNDWKKAISYMEDGILDLSNFITHTFELSSGIKALELARDRSEFYIKMLFCPSGTLAGTGRSKE